MPPIDHQLIEQIHAASRPLVLAVTGGGSGAISALLEVPGASATVLEAVVPYASRALEQWLGGTPDKYCSERTARAMAMAAFERARALSDADPRTLLGIGATASLASNRPKRGEHRLHVARQTAYNTVTVSHEFEKGKRTRKEEEDAVSTIILDAIAHGCGIGPRRGRKFDGRPLSYHEAVVSDEWTELLLGERSFVAYPPSIPKVLFPGSFNPLHAGHKRMAEIASEKLGAPVTFEVSITNVDKPPLDFFEQGRRMEQLVKLPKIFTRAPRFTDKAELAPGCTFVVGVDTISRIGDPKYYGGSTIERDAAITKLAAASCRFLVFGRKACGEFQSLSHANIPDALRRICDEVPESDFREDISSTELRST